MVGLDPMLKRSVLKQLFIASLVVLCSLAFAAIKFEQVAFDAGNLKNFEDLSKACEATPSASFWCKNLEAPLTLIPTKGNDYIFNDKGEILALFTKVQKGQNLKGNYNTNNAQNLIPAKQAIPGGAILINGEYVEPQNVKGSWENVSDVEKRGVFSFQLGDVEITKTILLKNTAHTLEVKIEAKHTGVSSEPVLIQYVSPGINQGDGASVVKIGQGETFSLNPVSQEIANPSYASLQTNDRNTGNALFLRPGPDETSLSAQFLQPNLVALQKMLPADSAGISLNVQEYAGPNELIRYYQEGHDKLPGLFRPNIFGQVSLGIVWVLEWLHKYLGNWGLSIIALTLLFRAVIWPLITAQTKSMYSMQAIQPKIQELQKKYKDDREKLTQETMKMYQENKVNPAGGCLPMVVQMPLFFILWRVFVNFEFNEGFLWVPDLGQADPIYILPILYVGVMVAQTFLSAKGNKQMLQQQLIMNVVFVFLFVTFPSGVILYYVVSMLVQLLQYWLIQRSKPLPAKA
jgi:YidC/Oxa1 family membrane protein insertase